MTKISVRKGSNKEIVPPPSSQESRSRLCHGKKTLAASLILFIVALANQSSTDSFFLRQQQQPSRADDDKQHICEEPHNETDGGDCKALLGEKRRPAWACRSDMRQALVQDFLLVYEQRPFKDNMFGMHLEHSFALWYILRQLQPATVIESGAYQGHSTWVIRQALPNARILSLDPDQPKQYLEDVEYWVGENFHDIASVQWKDHGIDPDETVVFLDDHQSSYRRVFLELQKEGFSKFLIEDNYWYGGGDNYSFKWACEVNEGNDNNKAQPPDSWPGTVPDDFGKLRHVLSWEQHLTHAAHLRQVLRYYYEFPPLTASELSEQTRYDPLRASTPIVADEQFFQQHLATAKGEGELKSYTHFAFVEIDLAAESSQDPPAWNS